MDDPKVIGSPSTVALSELQQIGRILQRQDEIFLEFTAYSSNPDAAEEIPLRDAIKEQRQKLFERLNQVIGRGTLRIKVQHVVPYDEEHRADVLVLASWKPDRNATASSK